MNFYDYLAVIAVFGGPFLALALDVYLEVKDKLQNKRKRTE